MRPNLSARTLLAAAVAVAALAGCRREEPDPVVPPPTATQPATTVPAPVLAPATSTAPLTLGNAIGDDNRIATPVNAFSSGDTIHASVETDGEARRLTARWTHLDSDQVVTEEHKDVAAGAQVTHFHVSNPDGWPTGRYQVEISQDGNVISSSEFEVR